MVSALPSRVMNYRVSSDSPSGELMILGQIYSEVGDYASSILDCSHLSLTRKCANRLKKVAGELLARNCIQSSDDFYAIPDINIGVNDLSALDIDELYRLYRRWPIRHKDRRAEGREYFTYYYEGRLVRELQQRKAAGKGEQLRIDYCVATYHNELDNMSFILSCPIKVDDDKIYPDSSRQYTPEELTALITLYRDYRDVVEREILVEYVDIALDLIENKEDFALIAELAEIGRKGIINVPAWVKGKLERTVDNASDAVPELPLAILALNMQDGDKTLFINRCYIKAFDEAAGLCERIECLRKAVVCCDYVTRFSTSESSHLWNELACQSSHSGCDVTVKHIHMLLEVAKELEGNAAISDDLRKALIHKLEQAVESGSIEALAYKRISELRF